jgi:hypothetical protein
MQAIAERVILGDWAHVPEQGQNLPAERLNPPRAGGLQLTKRNVSTDRG